MRSYLTQFFKEYAYPAEDAAFLLNTYDKISANPEAATLWQEALALYEADCNCDYEQIIAISDKVAEVLDRVNHYTTNLLIYICMSRHTAALYQQRGLDHKLFYETMLDLRYKLDECKVVKGVCGSFVAGWFARFFNLTRFGIGRLQFELKDFELNYEKDGKVLTPQSKVINIHIPRTQTPLTPESCDDAFRRAAAFFKDAFDGPCVFRCSSWLLFPEHYRFLSPKSNTYRFMRRFQLVSSGVYKYNDQLWRLFDTQDENPDRLPADSSMRRAYISHLKNGGRTGWGNGIFFYEE